MEYDFTSYLLVSSFCYSLHVENLTSEIVDTAEKHDGNFLSGKEGLSAKCSYVDLPEAVLTLVSLSLDSV